MADDHSHRRRAVMVVEMRKQLVADEMQEFVCAAGTGIERLGWGIEAGSGTGGHIAHAIDVPNPHNDQRRYLAGAGVEARGGSRRLMLEFAVQHDEHGIALCRVGCIPRGQRDIDRALLSECGIGSGWCGRFRVECRRPPAREPTRRAMGAWTLPCW